jgi:hypothetical protein
MISLCFAITNDADPGIKTAIHELQRTERLEAKCTALTLVIDLSFVFSESTDQLTRVDTFVPPGSGAEVFVSQSDHVTFWLISCRKLFP